MGERRIELSTPIRPTHYRLLAAMGISACFIAVVLAVVGALIASVVKIPIPRPDPGGGLTLVIERGEAEPETEHATEERVIPSLPQEEVAAEQPDPPRDLVTESSPEPSDDVKTVTDWQLIAEETAKASVDQYYRNEESRAVKWRQSRTIMFQPPGSFEIPEEDPVIPDFRFKPEIHVVGLGVTIGSCFVGIPLAGVPVEQRTVAMTFVVCAEDSG